MPPSLCFDNVRSRPAFPSSIALFVGLVRRDLRLEPTDGFCVRQQKAMLPESQTLSSPAPQLARLYLPITRCALFHSLRDRVNVFAGLYCFTVQLDSFLRTSRLTST